MNKTLILLLAVVVPLSSQAENISQEWNNAYTQEQNKKKAPATSITSQTDGYKRGYQDGFNVGLHEQSNALITQVNEDPKRFLSVKMEQLEGSHLGMGWEELLTKNLFLWSTTKPNINSQNPYASTSQYKEGYIIGKKNGEEHVNATFEKNKIEIEKMVHGVYNQISGEQDLPNSYSNLK